MFGFLRSPAPVSSTQEIPTHSEFPNHIAIVMDGNGRWASKRLMPRVAGHKRGLETVRRMVQLCIERGVPNLTLFAFSSENWRRPADEVSFLMQLFMRALREEVKLLHKHHIRLRVIGETSRFAPELQAAIAEAEALTAGNTALNLSIAANYGGRWDLMQAVNHMVATEPDRHGDFTEEDLRPHLCLADLPEPDLFIRTGGEQRVSNFLLWQLAYTEFYFTDCLWPEFDEAAFDLAIASFQRRERRFGRTSEQIKEKRMVG
ncbi:polyprenyl diphosphate synthase [Uliginosibacterium gangwonense]|uniref:polyprenyl diphosphate synthase n=1 Tax=Uliginosibacterium gangwonense TaxID=392736 RepID=UPI00037C7B7B|nr:polyprenyl diphosphate synthase [Uliginosibacterium gangwonense]